MKSMCYVLCGRVGVDFLKKRLAAGDVQVLRRHALEEQLQPLARLEQPGFTHRQQAAIEKRRRMRRLLRQDAAPELVGRGQIPGLEMAYPELEGFLERIGACLEVGAQALPRPPRATDTSGQTARPRRHRA